MSEILSKDITREMNLLFTSNSVLYDTAADFNLILWEVWVPTAPKWKQYGWKLIVPYQYQGEHWELIVIGFNAWDGTGDSNTYPEWSLSIPEEYQFDTNPTRVHPRAKMISAEWWWMRPLPLEAMIPIGTLDTEGSLLLHRNRSELEELWVVKGEVTRIWTLDRDNFMPKMLLTVSGEWESREGHEHAIFAPKNTTWRIQIAAFMAAEHAHSQVANLLNMHGLKLMK